MDLRISPRRFSRTRDKTAISFAVLVLNAPLVCATALAVKRDSPNAIASRAVLFSKRSVILPLLLSLCLYCRNLLKVTSFHLCIMPHQKRWHVHYAVLESVLFRFNRKHFALILFDRYRVSRRPSPAKQSRSDHEAVCDEGKEFGRKFTFHSSGSYFAKEFGTKISLYCKLLCAIDTSRL